MATQYATVEVWVCVDGNGDYGVGKDEALAVDGYEADVQPVCDAAGHRLVKLVVRVPLPTVIELSGEVTCEEEGASLEVRG